MQTGLRIPWKFDSYLTVAAPSWGGDEGAFGQANGKLRRIGFTSAAPQVPTETLVHRGGITALTAHPEGGYVSGGEDGRVLRLASEGAPVEWACHPRRWIEAMTVLPDGRLAYAAGKYAMLLDAKGNEIGQFGPHASTVTSLALFGEKLVACHYNGVTLWPLDAASEPRKLVWKGSHLAVALDPEGTILITSTQEGEIHGWKLDSHRELRIAGYPGKVKSLCFSADGRWLCTSGAAALIAWPFDGKGPEGRAPLELAAHKSALVTRVAAHPSRPFVACGFSDGALAMVDLETQTGGQDRVTRRGAVTCLAWARNGRHLLAGAEDGRAALFSVPEASEVEAWA